MQEAYQLRCAFPAPSGLCALIKPVLRAIRLAGPKYSWTHHTLPSLARLAGIATGGSPPAAWPLPAVLLADHRDVGGNVSLSYGSRLAGPLQISSSMLQTTHWQSARHGARLFSKMHDDCPYEPIAIIDPVWGRFVFGGAQQTKAALDQTPEVSRADELMVHDLIASPQNDCRCHVLLTNANHLEPHESTRIESWESCAGCYSTSRLKA